MILSGLVFILFFRVSSSDDKSSCSGLYSSSESDEEEVLSEELLSVSVNELEFSESESVSEADSVAFLFCSGLNSSLISSSDEELESEISMTRSDAELVAFMRFRTDVRLSKTSG